MVTFNRDALLVTGGGFEFDGLNSDDNYPQDPNMDYGKVPKIDPRTGEAKIFSRGHRHLR
jgi:hypothetical protein